MHHRIRRRSLLVLSAASPFLGASQGAAFHHQPATPVEVAISPLDPASTAVLVMDYQDAWLGTLADPDAVVSRAATAIGVAREHGVPVTDAQVTLTAA